MTMIGVLLSQTNCKKSDTVSGVGPGTSVHKVFKHYSVHTYITILHRVCLMYKLMTYR